MNMIASFELIPEKELDWLELYQQSEEFFGFRYHNVNNKYATAIDPVREMMLNITPKVLHFTILNSKNERNVITDIGKFISLNFKGKYMGLKMYKPPMNSLDDYIKDVKLIVL